MNNLASESRRLIGNDLPFTDLNSCPVQLICSHVNCSELLIMALEGVGRWTQSLRPAPGKHSEGPLSLRDEAEEQPDIKLGEVGMGLTSARQWRYLPVR